MGGYIFLNNDQVNKLNMYQSALQILKEHLPLIVTKEAMNLLYNKIQANYTAIDEVAVKRVSFRSGTTDVKKEIKNSTIDEIFSQMGLIYNYGSKTGREDIKASCSATHTDLVRMSYEVVYQKGMEIYNLANAELLNLVGYEINEESQAEFLVMLEAYHDLISKSSGKMAKGKSATQEMKAKFAETDELFDQMDNFMRKMKKADPEFFSQYTAAREILDYGVRHEEEVNPPQPPVVPQ